ncbi:adenosylcobinamide-phosphate synthase [Azoarcus sp. CIB]|uniref:adenosylcobinamide-phosphate synthase CbiB n=1 Tax=Aromatoleum sp. (strain CIB) TaxID=198107 RepID=UPI00067C40B3|nr:adenosylcobinamide-phosphate synthase CbiB [Azoarcus sp. CIB]AKU14017.1 adenosylcobinamide-phosphate synthase [Azoarcus sp. CIB]
MISLLVKLLAGIALDHLLGEPRRWHPLVGFGRWAGWLEARLRPRLPTRAGGLLAWLLAIGPWLALALLLRASHPAAHWLVDIGLLYFALGARSLAQHAEAIAAPLAAGDLDMARERVGWIVSRDTRALDAAGVAKAGTESVLENGNDAVFGALFWFCIAGGAGALVFRLANTLDAMWGYRTERFIRFGWAAARLDDILNWLPARLTALTYALLGRSRDALACWREQASAWDSPNAGPVMAAGAGALGVQLGGAAIYHGHEELRPPLGCGRTPDAASVRAAVRLMQHGMLLWTGIVAAGAIVAALAGAR